MRLDTLMSQLLQLGLRMLLTPELPKVPLAGRANAAVLKLVKKVRWPAGRFGLPTMSGRAPSVEPVMSAPSEVLKPGVNGVPDMAAVTPDNCQLPKTWSSNLLFSFLPRLGMSQV